MCTPELLINGTAAFPEILRLIHSAQRSIVINMFIWRADHIGCRMAEAILAAARRGVTVHVSVDRYGFVLEKSEECMHSFFHEHPSFSETVKIFALKQFYPALHPHTPSEPPHRTLLAELLAHPNIHISRDVFKADHSKFYIFDDEVLVLGGINIEDKENGVDLRGYEYGDYMIKISGRTHVAAFYAKLHEQRDISPDYRFTLNTKTCSLRFFETQETYLNLIRQAEHELVIVMAYFSPLRKFIAAIADAAQRGVRVTVMIPAQANFQNALNRKTMRTLLNACNGKINVYLSPKMLHTKLLYSEKTISMGSANITKKAFNQLSELNFTIQRDHSSFVLQLLADVQQNLATATIVSDPRALRYNVIMAFLEGFLV